MDKTDYDGKILSMLEDTKTYLELKRNPTATTENVVNKFIS